MKKITIEKLSKIGFGSHLTTYKNLNHRKALLYALENGCNLIDTSANYMEGESEILIGQVLSASGRDAFVISKTGYSPAEGLEDLSNNV